MGVVDMPKIKPISDLKNYKEVLKDVTVSKPVFLTKNGRGMYAIVALDEYESMQSSLDFYQDYLKNNEMVNVRINEESDISYGRGCLKGKIWMSDDFDEPLECFKEYME
jgi:prevent-host-death family protein